MSYKKSSIVLNVVLDIGEAYTKLGFAGENEPRSVIPTAIQKVGKIIKIFGTIVQVVVLNNIVGFCFYVVC